MKHIAPIVAVVACAASIAHGQPTSGVWRMPDGTTVPESESRRSINGFGAWLVVTPDQDWAEKWGTPSTVTPRFNEAKEVRLGGKLTTLIFFANPLPNSNGEVHVVCDIKVVRPNGSMSVDAPNTQCMRGPLQGPPANVRLGAPVLLFVAEPNDPPGVWRVEVIVRDLVRNVAVPVKTQYVLEK
jgi:hypothetical protein